VSQDVIIIGAPRSGTNMLRDVLTTLPGYGTWPCDEVPFLWRHGNRDYPSDEFSAEMARPEVRSYLKRQFECIRRRQTVGTVVEKTCANSLRVEFVFRCFPDARYLFITRDGIDAAASAMQRWHAPFALGYTARKARYVPPGDLPWLAARFVRQRLGGSSSRTTTSDDEVTSWWGPKISHRELIRTRPLEELCMLQWRRCVDSARRGLADVPRDQVHHVSYERFVRRPEEEVRAVLDFLRDRTPVDPAAVRGISTSSIGKGRRQLGPEWVTRLEQVGGDTLRGLRREH
jgi:hypothetical protein